MVPGARRASFPEWIAPQLATLTDDRFDDPGWIYERKLDGERCIAYVRRGRARLFTRNRKDAGVAYPEIVEALGASGVPDCVVDGEVVAFEGNRTSFARLQDRMQVKDPEAARATGVAVYYYVFDLLYADGYDLTGAALRARKARLRELVSWHKPLRLLTHRVRYGVAYYEQACARGWEGVIAKRADAPYRSGRSRDWLKFKCARSQEFVIGGFTDPKGSRAGLGALLIGVYEDGELVYSGKVGTGFDRTTLRNLRERLGRIELDRPPFARNLERLGPGVHWVRPELVCEVEFTEWTDDGRLRHPRYKGLRRDKAPRQVVREG